MQYHLAGSTRAATLLPPCLVEAATAHAPSWPDQMIAFYKRSLPAVRSDMQEDLTTRIKRLTGQTLAPEAVYVDEDGRWAVATVTGVTFRLSRQALVLVRPCAHCGTGHFESSPLDGPADVGYALAVWQPFHTDCAPTDPAD